MDFLAGEPQFSGRCTPRVIHADVARRTHRLVVAGPNRPGASIAGSEELGRCARYQRPLTRWIAAVHASLIGRSAAVAPETGVVDGVVAGLAPCTSLGRHGVLHRLRPRRLGHAPVGLAVAAVRRVLTWIAALFPDSANRRRDVGLALLREDNWGRTSERITVLAPPLPVPVAPASGDGSRLASFDAALHRNSLLELRFAGEAMQ